MVLKKDLVLYERDEKGDLIPLEVKLNVSEKYPELVGQSVKIVPLKRGEIKKLFNLDGKETDTTPETTKDVDGEIIVKNCKDPVFTMEDMECAKPVIIRTIMRTIFDESGIGLDKETGKKVVEDDEFGKNLDGSVEKEAKGD